MPSDIEEKVKCPHGKPNMVEFGAFGYRCVPTGCDKPCSLAELPEDDEEDEGTEAIELAIEKGESLILATVFGDRLKALYQKILSANQLMQEQMDDIVWDCDELTRMVQRVQKEGATE